MQKKMLDVLFPLVRQLESIRDSRHSGDIITKIFEKMFMNFDYKIDVSHLSLVFSLTIASILDETPAFHDSNSMSTLS